MANVFAAIGVLFVLYLIALGLESHFNGKKVAESEESTD